jgi:hypothetical protein
MGLREISANAPGQRRWQKSEAATANAGFAMESAGFALPMCAGWHPARRLPTATVTVFFETPH